MWDKVRINFEVLCYQEKKEARSGICVYAVDCCSSEYSAWWRLRCRKFVR